MEVSGAWNWTGIPHRLGIQDFDASIGSLSGGYRKRIAGNCPTLRAGCLLDGRQTI